MKSIGIGILSVHCSFLLPKLVMKSIGIGILSVHCSFLLPKLAMKSIGIGKIIVEFFSPEIEFNV